MDWIISKINEVLESLDISPILPQKADTRTSKSKEKA
jgi:hypothetical protein